jgi:xanthine/CO dehydrogenase XdhC/CoxF family maturation factor
VTGARAVTIGAACIDVLVECVVPPPRLFVFGGGQDVLPLVALASGVGWEVLVCIPHASPSARGRFAAADVVRIAEADGLDALRAHVDASARAACVVMGHDFDRDREVLAMLLSSSAAYIGVLGPRARTERMLAGLVERDDPAARVHAPVGLALGAEGPQEIALAIVAEVQSVFARTTGTSLREEHGPIHAPAGAVT